MFEISKLDAAILRLFNGKSRKKERMQLDKLQ